MIQQLNIDHTENTKESWKNEYRTVVKWVGWLTLVMEEMVKHTLMRMGIESRKGEEVGWMVEHTLPSVHTLSMLANLYTPA